MKLLPFLQWTNVLAGLVGLTLAGQVALAQVAPNASKNLLVNGTFEKGTEGWTFTAHDKHGQMTIDENEKRGNRSTLRMDNPVGDDSHVKQKVTVKPNTRYRITGYIKTKDVETVKRDGKDGACIAVEGGFQRTPSVVKTKSWTRVTHDFVTGGETEIEIGARLGFFSAHTTGTAWFSDISLEEMGKAPPRR